MDRFLLQIIKGRYILINTIKCIDLCKENNTDYFNIETTHGIYYVRNDEFSKADFDRIERFIGMFDILT